MRGVRLLATVSLKNRGVGWVFAQLALFISFALVPAPPLAWQVAGGALLLLAACLLISAALALGTALSPFPTPTAHANLITTGIFAWIRHPIYVAVVLAAIAISFMSHSAWRATITVVLAIFFDAKARLEERMLLTRYPSYASYAEKTYRFLPWIY